MTFTSDRLVESPKLRQRLGCAARQMVKRHTWERTAEQLENLFALAMAEHQQQTGR